MYMHIIKMDDFRGMDGSSTELSAQVDEMHANLNRAGYCTAGDGVDACVALAMMDSNGDRAKMLQHLDYQIAQLQAFRRNVAVAEQERQVVAKAFA